jgi:hypothetical protein
VREVVFVSEAPPDRGATPPGLRAHEREKVCVAHRMSIELKCCDWDARFCVRRGAIERPHLARGHWNHLGGREAGTTEHTENKEKGISRETTRREGVFASAYCAPCDVSR